MNLLAGYALRVEKNCQKFLVSAREADKGAGKPEEEISKFSAWQETLKMHRIKKRPCKKRTLAETASGFNIFSDEF